MPLILVGYGDYEDYRVTELPLEALEELTNRYPLAVAEDFSPEYDYLIITIAVHAELNRRKAGGKQQAHIPSRRELAQLIIKRGFQQASKQHHPDGDGHHDAQVRLADVRDTLLTDCENIPNDRPEDAVIIPAAPVNRATVKPRAAAAGSWDDDVPF
jgi:hypothetical protein